MKKKIIITVLVLAVTALTAIKLFSNQQAVEDKVYHPDPDKKVLVKALPVEERSLDKAFVYTGTFRPFREIMLIPQAQGEVKAVHFNEGDVVPEGKLLLQIDDELLRARHIAAQAAYQTSKRNFERYEKASESDGVSKMQYDNFWQQYKSAESQLKQLEKSIRLSKLTAPFSGTITLRDVEVGSVAGNGAVGRLTDLSRLKLEIAVPENEIVLFNEGDQAEIRTDVYPGLAFTGKVDYVADRADESHNYMVKILLKNNRETPLKAGMYGTVVLNKDLNNTALVIPRSALLGSAKNPQVFVIENGTSVLKNILTGSSNGLEVEVVKGLKPGDVVVASGQINLADGSNVEIAQ